MARRKLGTLFEEEDEEAVAVPTPDQKTSAAAPIEGAKNEMRIFAVVYREQRKGMCKSNGR